MLKQKMQAVSFKRMPSEYRVNPVKREDYKNAQFNRDAMQNLEQNAELKKAYMDAVRLANLTDQQLLNIAKRDAHKDDKYKLNTYAATLLAVPTIDTFMKGITTEAPKLSGKLGAMGKTATGWAAAFALAGIYGDVVKKVTAVSPTMQKFKEKHPVLKSLLSLTGFMALLIGGQKGLSKLVNVLPKKMPGVAADLAKARTFVADFINNSKVNTKVLRPLKDKVVAWASKYPKATGTTLSALAWSVPAMVIGSLFKIFTDKAEKAEQVKDNYAKLVNVREQKRNLVEAIHNAAMINDAVVFDSIA